MSDIYQIKRSSRCALYTAVALLFLLPACSFDMPTTLSDRRVEVTEKTYKLQMPAAEVSDAVLSAVANDFERVAAGPAEMITTYDPASKKFTAVKAQQDLSNASKALQRQGVRFAKQDILPVHGSNESVFHINFAAYEAKPPAGCGMMTDLNQDRLNNLKNHELGCGIEFLLAKQIYRPGDLLGRDEADVPTSGRRLGNIMGPYKGGEPNQPLDTQGLTDQ